MKEDEKCGYRLIILKELTNRHKKEMNSLSIKLINYAIANTIIKNVNDEFIDKCLFNVKTLALKFNNKQWPTELLTRMLQFFSFKTTAGGEYQVNIITFAYCL